MCTSQPSAMPALGIETPGSLPSMSEERGSAPALRWPWHNRKRTRDIRSRRRARRNADSVHKPPDVTCASPVQHRDPLPGGHDRRADSQLERHTVKPSIIASERVRRSWFSADPALQAADVASPEVPDFAFEELSEEGVFGGRLGGRPRGWLPACYWPEASKRDANIRALTRGSAPSTPKKPRASPGFRGNGGIAAVPRRSARMAARSRCRDQHPGGVRSRQQSPSGHPTVEGEAGSAADGLESTLRRRAAPAQRRL